MGVHRTFREPKRNRRDHHSPTLNGSFCRYEEVVNPAIAGCKNAIKFAAKNGVKRVVLTSSVWSTCNLMVPQ